MFHRLLASAVILSASAVAMGGSIFDDDYSGPASAGKAPSVRPPAPPPEREAPAPAAQPAPPAQPEPAPAGAQTPPPGTTPDAEPKPAEKPGLTPVALPPEKAVEPNVEAIRTALNEARQRQEAEGAAALAKSADYAKAKADLADAKTKLKDQTMSAEEKAEAWNASLAASTKERSLHDRILAACPAAVEVKRLNDQLAATAPAVASASPVASAEPAGDRPPEILDAIKRHDLVVGMTYREACKASRLPNTMIQQNGTEKVYRWIIKGRTGTTHTESDGRGYRTTYHTVADYGVVAYVEGTFENDSLTGYKRVSRFSKKSK